MNEHKWANCSVQTLVNEFFEQDDLHKLAEDTGILLECPLLIIDETFLRQTFWGCGFLWYDYI